VSDYDRYHLSPPRRGHYYARTEAGELLLIAAATGLVVWALTN
jgi:Ni/Co efflux regulator RcnB